MESLNVLDIPIDQIEIGERQRKNLGSLETLEIAISEQGLIQPIVVEKLSKNRYLLLAGNRRLHACMNLNMTTIPSVTKENTDEITRFEIEYIEDRERKERTWQETVEAEKKLLKMYADSYSQGLPKRFGKGQRQVAEELGISEAKLSQDLQLAEALEVNPELRAIVTRREALKKLNQIKSGIIKPEKHNISLFREHFVHGNLDSALKGLTLEVVNLLVTDMSGVVYEESLQKLLPFLSPIAHGFLFFPLNDLSLVVSCLKKLKLQVSDRPYIWHIRGSNKYQSFLWFSRTLREPPRFIEDHMSHSQESNALHEYAKGYQLLSLIVQNTTGRGEFVFDPFCYGSSLIKVCLDQGRNVLCYCSDKILHGQIILSLER